MRLRLDPFAPSGVSIAPPAPVITNPSSSTTTDSGVAAGTYGDATNVGQFTVDSAGRITFAQNVAVAAGSNLNYAALTKLGIGSF